MPAGSYSASSPSLFGNPGGPMAPRYSVDIPGAIDSLANSASSLIHAAYLRKMARNEVAHRDAREKIMDDRYAADQATKDSQWQQEHDLRVETARRQDMTSGITPGKKETTVAQGTPAQLPQVQGQASPIQSAMGAPAPGSAIQQTPSSAPAPAVNMALPQPTLQTTTTPDSYDPTKAAGYVRSVETARIRGETMREVAQQRIAAQQAGREFMANAAIHLAQVRAQLAAKAKTAGGISKAMTGNVMERAREQAAIGLIDRTNGSYDDAAALLAEDSPTGKQLRDLGVEPRHLMFGHAQYVRGAVGNATRLQAGPLMMTPGEAVGAVKETRELVGGPGAKPAAAAAPAPAATVPAPAPKKLVAPAPAAAPATAAPPGGGQQATFDQEAKLYQRAVATIKANFKGQEQADRLKKASDLYNTRVAAAAGTR